VVGLLSEQKITECHVRFATSVSGPAFDCLDDMLRPSLRNRITISKKGAFIHGTGTRTLVDLFSLTKHIPFHN